ncbi:LysR family transcriptional regulator [Corynebacterium epidermidicanis]|uniref:Transcriptional regulator n=1 Tax=Corynebacterium epidermidicanis TaxID=1050174 RepID=A0A0G3GNB6_9CORY|nr:LysR family transcriptional regulator [Corynebacterium epidermidicanis]AKK02065.1 transcriptional regulator [Corynebacterium epidermidicanis]
MNFGTEDLRSFIAVADEGHLTDTADKLGIPQPTLSRRIARIESALGTELFDRVGRSLVLNTRGTAFLAASRRIIHEVDAATTEVHRLMDPELGTVRLGFMHSLGTWLVPALLRQYRSQHPNVQFELVQADALSLAEAVLNDALDLAFVAPAPQLEGVAWHEVSTQQLAIAVPEDHRLADAKSVCLKDLENEPFVGMYPGYGIQILLERLCAATGFAPKIAFTTMEMTTVGGLVAAGLGIALLPMGDDRLIPDGVALVPLEPRTEREIGLVWREAQAENSPPVRMFKDFVLRSGRW